MIKAYLIHGWDGSPTNCWFPWLMDELQKEGIEVKAIKMPHPANPTIKDWVATLEKNIKPDKETILIGHSIGCQTILRYLEKNDVRVRACFLIAPWLHLTNEEDSDEAKAIAKPWLEIPIDFKKVKARCTTFTALFSDDDPVVPVSDAKLFEKYLGAKTIIEHNKSHYDIQSTNPTLLKSIQKLIK